MNHRELNDLLNDQNITPEDVARFCLYEHELNDIDKYRTICDLVVKCEKSQIKKLEAKCKKQEEALREISQSSLAPTYDYEHGFRKMHQIGQIATKALKP